VESAVILVINSSPAVLQPLLRASLRAQVVGCHKLMSVILSEGGFKRVSTAKECVRVVLEAMRTYSFSIEMQKLGGLLIGWSCYGRRESTGPAPDERASGHGRHHTYEENFGHGMLSLSRGRRA
jgi:hypothetical protein